MMRSQVPIGWIIAVVFFPAAVLAQTPSPTFAKDIAPLLYAKCAMCHRPGEVAPMSFMSYNEARPWARAIKAKVLTREMPPWHAEGEPGRWSNDRRLSQGEIEKIVAWVDAGAPRGNDSDMPAPPQFAQGWNHPSGRPPDVIIEAPEMNVPADGESPWQFAYVKLPFQGDVWVAAAQIVPGNPKVVHHVLVTPATLPPDVQLDAEGRVINPGTRSAPAAGGIPSGGFRDNGGFSQAWEPGIDQALIFPPGVATRISATHFSFNLHYQANGKASTDKTRIGLWLEKGPVTAEIGSLAGGGGFGSDTFIAEGEELLGRYTAQVTQDIPPPGTKTVPNIPPFAGSYHLIEIIPVRQERTLYAFQPHMHLRGQSLKYTAVLPDGREEVLFDVPKYDFNWQIMCALAKPITLPAGSTIRVDATWNNSANNKYNPRPDQEVFWGEQSWDEMLSPMMVSAVPLKSPITPKPPVLQSSQP